jgi:hypothetical protein
VAKAAGRKTEAGFFADEARHLLLPQVFGTNLKSQLIRYEIYALVMDNFL